MVDYRISVAMYNRQTAPIDILLDAFGFHLDNLFHASHIPPFYACLKLGLKQVISMAD
jgi:hypothetical protein